MKPRDLRIYHLLSRYSVRKSFDSLTLAQDDNVGGKPTNSEFIALIANKLQLQLKSAEVGNF